MAYGHRREGAAAQANGSRHGDPTGSTGSLSLRCLEALQSL